MRLIDADALKEKLPPVLFIEASCRDCPVIRSYVGLGNLINEAPSIDAAPQWISVKDRLPEEDDNTKAWYEGPGGIRARTVIVYDGDSVFPANRIRTSTGEPYEWSISAKNATHWMPLPEPPKEEI